MSNKKVCDRCGKEESHKGYVKPTGWAIVSCSSYGLAKWAVRWDYDFCGECAEALFPEAKAAAGPTESKDYFQEAFKDYLTELVDEAVGERTGG